MTRPASLKRSVPSVPRPSAPGSTNIKEPAHLPLHRRLLFPSLPPSQPLPALVPGSDPDILLLNEKIYSLIALAFRAYILSWLPRITRDRSLLPQIHSCLIAPLLVPIFASLQAEPERLILFLLYDLPALLTRHWEVYWQARTAADQALPYDHSDGDDTTSGIAGLDAIYHAHLPLRSVEPMAAASDADGPEPGKTVVPAGQYVVSPLWLGALVDTLMKRSLSPDEYAVDVERVMMRDILARTVLGGIARRIAEPAFWYALLLKFLPVRHARPKDAKNRAGWLETAGGVLDRMVNMCFTVWAMGVWVVAAYTAAPPGYRQSTRCWLELGRETLSVDGRMGWTNWPLRIVWAIVEVVFLLLTPVLDRLLPDLIRLYLLQPGTALRLVDLLERILFPLDGYPAPTPPDPSAEETIAMRREIEERLGMLIPGPVRRVITPAHTDVEWLLAPWTHAGCNAHLVAVMYASAAGLLVPEMVVGAPTAPMQA